MSNSPHDSCSIIEHGRLVESSHGNGPIEPQRPPFDFDRDSEVPKKTDSFARELMRDRQKEPRYFVYVYDYSENKTKIMRKQNLLNRRGQWQTLDTSSRRVFLCSIVYGDEQILNFEHWT
jgi:hypothetical protein